MVAVSFTLAPVFQRNLRSFSAPDPWLGGPPQRWNLNLYFLVVESAVPGLQRKLRRREAAGRPDPAGAPLPGGRRPGKDEAIGFALAEGGQAFLLPYALQQAWWAGEVPDARLPDIFAALQPSLSDRDYIKERRATGIWVGLGLILAIGLGVAGAMLALLPSQEHMMRVMEPRDFLTEPQRERFVALHGGLPVRPVEAVDASRLRAVPGLELPPGLDTLGIFGATDGSRRLMLYGNRRGQQTPPEMLAIGPTLRAERLGLDTARAAAATGADPNFVFVQGARWNDFADPTGLAHTPLLAGGIVAVFAACAAMLGAALALQKRRTARLRTRVLQLLAQVPRPLG